MKAQNENEPMTFTFSTALHHRKLEGKVFEQARYVDLDPMIIHVKAGDKLVFNAMDEDLVIDNLPGGTIIVPKGDSYTYNIGPELEKLGRVKLPLKINGENLEYKSLDEDPELIIDDQRP
jgi:hypothetical protein